MNRKAIIFLLVIVLAMAGCDHRHYQQSEPVEPTPTATIVPTQAAVETVAPTPTSTPKPQESADAELSTVYIDDAVISIGLPSTITESAADIGQIYKADGYASADQQGNLFTLEVYRFFEREDQLATISSLLLYDESMEIFALGSDIEYKSIMSGMEFADGLGHISKVTYNNMEKYTATIYGGGVFYRIILKAQGDYSSDDIALKILSSLQLDGNKASAKAAAFSVNLNTGTYYSQKQQGVSIACPDNWLPAESMHFSLNKSVLSMMTADQEATVTARYYSKASLPSVQTYDDFVKYMLLDLLNRQLIEITETDEIQYFSLEGKRAFCMPPTDNVIIRYYLEYTDGYYCVEIMYKGSDANVVTQLLDIGESFVGVGEEIVH